MLKTKLHYQIPYDAKRNVSLSRAIWQESERFIVIEILELTCNQTCKSGLVVHPLDVERGGKIHALDFAISRQNSPIALFYMKE
ncbi:uncharacterized protein PHALS_14840 [Plasmopara halstedii]|uniref:Uncharacterized protein n=1 Tax=Plasmopara halstedii TaxID=4781 RepID=A0A0P1ATS4_PLAHL|nr:uncharacterized protein PHALS_14840 [Plasmopara halstedii]CEG45772.1 hypothetical protein PHALS_14840 [Plasmopara halstedii]|eukprot:XP_024582141.1 hypothetical protein PHALS_14840 [Plasmopara halstedii]